MAFSESNRVQLRRYLGYGPIYTTADPRFESAITSVQSIADGGARPDNTTELAIISYLTDLSELETKLKALWDQAQAVDADGLKIDVPRAMAMLRMEGRRLVGYISDALQFKPIRDVFSSPKLSMM